MKKFHVYTRPIFRCALAAAFLAPTIAWSHGAVDIPVARQVKCKVVGGYWSSANGSGIADAGCRAAAAVFPTSAEQAYQMDQWNEVANLIAAPGYNDPDEVKAAVPDGQLCSAGDTRKRGLDVVSPSWYKTSVMPVNGKIQMRIIGTAPHVPSFVKVYITQPGYTGTSPLKWSDLSHIHTEELATARTNWSTPSAIPGASGFFQFDVPIPNGQTGYAVLFTQWQRIDPAGEGFYNCSDINIESQSDHFPWYDTGTFINPNMTPKANETVQFRVMGHDTSANEIVDIEVPITADNLAPAVWGAQLADQLAESANIIRVGIRSGVNIVFDAHKIHDNLIYLTSNKDSTAMSILRTTTPVDPTPLPPEAVITGDTSVKAGEQFTLSATRSIGHPGPLRFHWLSNIIGPNGPYTAETPTITITAPTKAGNLPFYVSLSALDDGIKKSGVTKVNITVDYASGNTYPTYVAGTKYNAGDIVSNNGKNYACKPHPYTGWCSGAATYYAPGTGLAWKEAWDEK